MLSLSADTGHVVHAAATKHGIPPEKQDQIQNYAQIYVFDWKW